MHAAHGQKPRCGAADRKIFRVEHGTVESYARPVETNGVHTTRRGQGVRIPQLAEQADSHVSLFTSPVSGER